MDIISSTILGIHLGKYLLAFEFMSNISPWSYRENEEQQHSDAPPDFEPTVHQDDGWDPSPNFGHFQPGQYLDELEDDSPRDVWVVDSDVDVDSLPGDELEDDYSCPLWVIDSDEEDDDQEVPAVPTPEVSDNEWEDDDADPHPDGRENHPYLTGMCINNY
jgi:hypothetical protein